MPVAIKGSGGGSVTLTAAAAAADTTLTIPNTTGTVALTASPTFTGTVTATTVTSPAATALTIQSAGTTAMTVDTSQNVGIGTTSPNAAFKLDVTGAFRATTGLTVNGGNALQLLDSTNNNSWYTKNNANNLTFTYNSSEYMRLSPLGYLMVGTTTSLGTVTFTGPSTSDLLVLQTTATSGSPSGLVYKNGSGTVAGYVSINAASNTVTYTNSSDERLKTNPRDFSGLDLVSQMKPKKYERICQLGTDEIGLYAQELSGILPEAVSIGDEDVNKKPWGIDYGRITPVLIKAIQELSAKNDALEARLAALEAK
jgi:Chaperone of endosialidase